MSRMSSAQVGNAKKLNNYEPSKHFYQLIMDKCVSLLAVFLWGVFTSNVIVNSETPTEHLKWAQVVSCAHDGEDHCQQNNTSVTWQSE